MIHFTKTKKYKDAVQARDWMTCDLIAKEYEFIEKDEFYHGLSFEMRRLRKLNGLTQDQASSLLNVKRSAYAMWENNYANPRVFSIYLFAKKIDGRILEVFKITSEG